VSRPEPTYVVEVDAATARVLVGASELLACPGLQADRVSWVAGHPPAPDAFDASVRVRYRGEDVPATLETHGEDLRARFASPQRGIAPGQSVVVYRGEDLLGGGRIVRSLSIDEITEAPIGPGARAS
jgi:tRNA-specific 2-thiouridylase